MSISRRNFVKQSSWLAAATSAAAAFPTTLHSKRFGAISKHMNVTGAEHAGQLVEQERINKLVLAAVEAAKSAGATFVDARVTRTVSQIQLDYTWIDNEQISMGVRAFVNGVWGFAASPYCDLDEAVILAKSAVSQAKVNSDTFPRDIDLGSYPAVNGHWTTPIEIDPFTLPMEDRIAHIRSFNGLGPRNVKGRVYGSRLSKISLSRLEKTVATSEGSLYYPYTDTWYSITVRAPGGNGSGWARVDFRDWNRVDAEKLTLKAIDKCLKSLNPVAIEPGRYTAILEPQAVAVIFDTVPGSSREQAENGSGPFADGGGYSKIGLKVLDERITVRSDPMDPDVGFPPFDRYGNVYHPVTWIESGILKELSYGRRYGIEMLGINKGLPYSGSYRMDGGDSSIEEMIETTRRGVLVTRFDRLGKFTRDGLWLVENGKISKAIKNFRYNENPLFIFNNLVSLGKAEKVYSPYNPVMVPSAKVRDFNFTSLIDAI